MKLVDPRARALWRTYQKRARLASMDVPSSVRRTLMADLEAHVVEALSREQQQGLSELQLVEQVLARLGDPVLFLRPILEEASRSTHAKSQRRWPLAAFASALMAALISVALVSFGANALWCPGSVGLFQLSADEFQVRLSCGSPAGTAIGAPWVAIGCIAAGALMVGWAWRRVLRVRSALLLRRGGDDSAR